MPFGPRADDVFLWTATIGTLILLVVYAMATVGAVRLLFFSGERKVPLWEIVIPIAALVVLGYTLYRNVIPYPALHTPTNGLNASFVLPIVCGVWIALAIILVVARPAIARRAGQRLTVQEGLSNNVVRVGEAAPAQPQAAGTQATT